MKTVKAEVVWEYYDDGKLYSEKYRVDRKLHNPEGPAFRCWHSNGQLWYEIYYLNGQGHNPEGPAYRKWYANGQLTCETYWINGKKLTKEQFESRNKPSCNDKVVEIDGKKYKLTAI